MGGSPFEVLLKGLDAYGGIKLCRCWGCAGDGAGADTSTVDGAGDNAGGEDAAVMRSKLAADDLQMLSLIMKL